MRATTLRVAASTSRCMHPSRLASTQSVDASYSTRSVEGVRLNWTKEFPIDGRVGDYVHRYRSLGLTGSPMTPDQIAELERSLGLPLPAAYLAYLLIAG